MKNRILILLAVVAMAFNSNAQTITITEPSDTAVSVQAVGGAETVTIKADIVPLVSSATTSDTVFIFRHLFNPAEALYYTTGDTLVVTDASPNTSVKTYTSNRYSYFTIKTVTDTTSTATLNIYIK